METMTLKRSARAGKKWVAVFSDGGTIHFGQRGAEDFTMHGDERRRENYLRRHGGGREDWGDPGTAGALSRWLLWEKRTMKEAAAAFGRRFRLRVKMG